MTVTITYTKTINKCRECPLRKNHRGHGECWDYCTHEKARSGYGNIIAGCMETIEPDFPKWCPYIKETK